MSMSQRAVTTRKTNSPTVAQSAASLARATKRQVVTLTSAVGVAWLAFAATTLTGGWLLSFGIAPRTIDGLRGILFAPLLHANLSHLLANTIPFVVLGWLVMLRDSRAFTRVTIAAALTSGLASWLLGAPGSIHIGASGVIFGYLGYLMANGWYARTIGSVLISIGVTAAWGGLVFGVLPTTPGVSWQGHLGGLIGGVLVARAMRKR